MRYHSNPNMNPPTRQKLKHHRALWRKHLRILLRFLLRLLFLREARAWVVHRSAGGFAIASLHDAARGMRRRTELVGLGERVLTVILVLRQARERGGEGAAVGWDCSLSSEGVEGSCGGGTSGEEELGDCDWHGSEHCTWDCCSLLWMDLYGCPLPFCTAL